MTEKEKKTRKKESEEKSDATKRKPAHHQCEEHPTGCCGGSCNIHTPKRVIAYRDERFLFGFVSGLAISAIVGFIILTNGGVVSSGARINETATTTAETKVVKGDWVRGNPKAKVAIIEFSDIDCPYCKRFHETMKEVVEESGGKVKWVYRHAPLDSLHPNARVKAHVAECIGEQGGNEAFWNALDRLMLGKDIGSQEEFVAFVEAMGADKDAFDKCMGEGRYKEKIQRHLDEAQASGMKGTPFSVILIGEKVIPLSGALPKSRLMEILTPLMK